MKVFISWSGEASRRVAEVLRTWLPDIIQSLEPWMSGSDIEAGARWGKEIAQQLSETSVGIVCLTPENQRSPWILFEAGALAKSLSNTFVCPYLICMEPEDLQPGPLVQFQAMRADREGTWNLLRTLNRALQDNALLEERLRRLFDRAWPDLEPVLDCSNLQSAKEPKRRSSEDMIPEILALLRALERRFTPEKQAEAVLTELALSPEHRASLRQLLSDSQALIDGLARHTRRESASSDADPRIRQIANEYWARIAALGAEESSGSKKDNPS